MVVDGVEELVLLLVVDGSWFVSVVVGVGLCPGVRLLFSSVTDSCLVLLSPHRVHFVPVECHLVPVLLLWRQLPVKVWIVA